MGDALALTFKNLQLAFADLFAPFTTKGIISVEQFKAAMIALGSALVVNGIFRLVAAFKALNVALKEGVALSVAISGASGIKGAITGIAAIGAYIATLKALESDKGEGASWSGIITGPPLQGQTGGGGGNGVEESLAVKAMRLQIIYQKDLMGFAKDRNRLQLQYLDGSQDELKLAESQLKYQEDIRKAIYDRDQLLNKEQKSLELQAQINAKYEVDAQKALDDRNQRNALIRAQRDAALAGFKQENQFIAERNKLIESGFLIELDSRNMSESEIERAKELLNIQGRLTLIEQERQRIFASAMAPEERQLEYERLEIAEKSIIRQGELSLERIRLNEQEIKNFTDGWEKAWREFARSADNYGKVAESAFSSITDNMSRAIANFVQTGKLSVKDFARSIIQDLIRIQMTAQANALFKSARNLFSFASPESIALMSGMAPLAEGGPASANTPYLVGERGPELFMPSTAGTVVPNNKLGGMGATTNVTNYNIQAIDTKSFEDRLFGSANAVWAANAYANKSLATNGGRA